MAALCLNGCKFCVRKVNLEVMCDETRATVQCDRIDSRGP